MVSLKSLSAGLNQIKEVAILITMLSSETRDIGLAG